METPSSAIIKNYANCVPKKSGICSAAENFSRHGQTDKNRIGKASDWKAKPRYTKVTSEDQLELSFQTVNSQDNEIAFETSHIVFEEPCISCYQVSVKRPMNNSDGELTTIAPKDLFKGAQAEMNTMSAPQGTNYGNDTRDLLLLLLHEQPNIHTGDKLSNAEEWNSKQDIDEDILRHENNSHETQYSVSIQNSSNMEPRRVKINPAIENFSPAEKSKKGTKSVANMTLMDQKSVTEEDCTETNGSETEFTKNESNVLEKSSFSIGLPKLSESAFMRKNAFITSESPTSQFHFSHEPLNKELPPPYSYKVPRKRKPPDKICEYIIGLG